MNMPNRASCHHFIRRMRSASSPSEAACGSVVGIPGCQSTVALLAEVAATVTSEALVPNSQSRRAIRFGPMASASKKSFSVSRAMYQDKQRWQASRRIFGYSDLFFKLEDSFHQQPLFAGLSPGQRQLK